MDPEPSVLRSGRRWRPPPPAAKHPVSSNTDQAVPAGPIPGAAATALFSCSVCHETASDPVVTHCGHLFCWPCLYRWVRHRRPRGRCPVCKSAVPIDPDDDGVCVTPIYGIAGGRDHGGGGGDDGVISPEVPPRPRGVRGDALRDVREGLRELSRDVDTLEERMVQVMAWMAELQGESGTSADSFVATGMSEPVGVRSHGDDGVGDGVYRGTRSRMPRTGVLSLLFGTIVCIAAKEQNLRDIVQHGIENVRINLWKHFFCQSPSNFST